MQEELVRWEDERKWLCLSLKCAGGCGDFLGLVGRVNFLYGWSPIVGGVLREVHEEEGSVGTCEMESRRCDVLCLDVLDVQRCCPLGLLVV